MNRMLNIGVAAAALMVMTTGAGAESLTFSGSGQIVNQVFVPGPGGRLMGGGYSTGTSETTLASGKKLATKNQCVQWSAEPGSIFTSQGVCTVGDSTGTYSVGFSCQADAKNTNADCWGRISGMTGAYVNKIGTASWHSIGSADNKSITFAGTGMWD